MANFGDLHREGRLVRVAVADPLAAMCRRAAWLDPGVAILYISHTGKAIDSNRRQSAPSGGLSVVPLGNSVSRVDRTTEMSDGVHEWGSFEFAGRRFVDG
jgi:hypothetical protein